MSKKIGIPNSAPRARRLLRLAPAVRPPRDRCLLRHAPVVRPPRARRLPAARPLKYEGRPAAEPQGHHQSLAEARRWPRDRCLPHSAVTAYVATLPLDWLTRKYRRKCNISWKRTMNVKAIILCV